jgi:hypothetical protein
MARQPATGPIWPRDDAAVSSHRRRNDPMKRSRPLRRVPLRRAGYLDRSTPLRPGPPPKRRTELRRFRPLVAAASLAASPASATT